MEREKGDLGYCDYLKKAREALAEEQVEDAIEFYDQAITSKDCGSSVYYLKAELLFTLDRIEEAVDLITKFGQKQNNIKHTFYVTSKHFEWRGKIDEASFWWEKYQNLIHERDESSPNITKKHLTLISGGI